MIQAHRNEEVTQKRHKGEDRRSDGSQSQNPPQDDFAGADRFGHDGKDRLRLEFGRQTQRTEEEDQQENQIVGGRQNEVQVEGTRILVRRIDEPAGEHQQNQKDDRNHHDLFSDRFLNHQTGDRQDAPPRQVNQIARPAPQGVSEHSVGSGS